ncbi:hypothetical protein DACRYDRAFT_44631 [Dacryopinax primogenitus]|uniref:Uncharacterized protein n=1 Tax=Dacryopinax primogenitus (strain DJM 731) TaxID=1858805 RepID=M5GFP1_DACPD|nr:uncharacterized protein DACRYDRAFT_44631 [Dacryopinax primogenitus]EJU06482.1 hypothetical protein DACRYDRAFT_44631 [Dacryopinax primogenitus]
MLSPLSRSLRTAPLQLGKRFAHSTGKKTLFQTWFAVEAIPIYVVVLGAVSGAGWYLTRLARGPDVIWDRKNNPTPWNNVTQDMNTKMMAVNARFDKSWVRDRL